MATLKEIANKIDVSITTVSRVLNNDTSLSVSDEIRKKIFKTATSMGYKTPRQRVRLKSNKRLSIAIIHWFSLDEETNNNCSLLMRRGIEQLSINSNINTFPVYKSNGEYDLSLLEGVNGLICIGKFSRENISSFENISKNIVFVDSSPNEKKFDSVMYDLNSSIREILAMLIDKGYKRIGYIGGQEYVSATVKIGQKREFIFRDYLYQRNLLDSKFIHVGPMSSKSGYDLMKNELLSKDKAEVYLCSDDSIALGALRAINEKGIKVPEEIGIIGFNNDHTSAYTFPPLTSVDTNSKFIGEQALRSMIEILEGRTVPVKKIIPTKIVIRQTIK